MIIDCDRKEGYLLVKQNKKAILDLYKSVEQKIKSLDFEKIYPGFKPYDFALYDENIVVFKDKIIPYDRRFVGNTAIKFDDDFLAIWQIESIYVHYNVLTSKIIHEMFHAWQMNLGEKRFPNEFRGLGYLYEKYNIATKYEETKFLLKAYEEEDLSSLEKFVSLRERRRKDYIYEVEYEEGIETIEGMAKYVELQVLKQLDVNDYQKAYDQLKSGVKNIKNYIPIRIISYDIGALMLLVKDRFGFEVNEKIGIETNNIFHILFDQIEPKDSYYENTVLDLSFLEEYYESIMSRIKYVLGSNPKIHDCDSVIGFDPINSFRIGKYVYYRHFVMIENQSNQKFIPNESVGELDDFNQVYVIYERSI